jgi:type VI protein secretion system component VasK
MRIEHLVEAAVGHLFGRLMRSALVALAVAALGIVAIYYFTAAGTIALDAQYGVLHTRVIVGAIYAAATIACAIWWAMRRRPASSSAPALSGQRDMQIAMLVEAVMLGYALAQKGDRAR